MGASRSLQKIWVLHSNNIPTLQRLFLCTNMTTYSTRPSLLHSIPRFAMHTIASIWTGSHHLQCETRRWHAACLTRTPPLEKLCTLCYQGTIEFEQHSFSECDAYSSTKQNFKTIVSWHLYITVFLHQCGQIWAMGAYSEWYWRQYFDH